jgi:acyl carrier protein
VTADDGAPAALEALGDLCVRTASGALHHTGARARLRRDGRWEVCVSGDPPSDAAEQDGAAQDAPWTATQRRVAEIWAQALQLDHIGLHDDFFAIGGNSLLAMRLVSKINEELNLDVPWAQFLRDPTVAALAAAIDEAAPVASRALRPSVRRDAARLLDELDDLSEAQLEALFNELGS